MRASGLPAPLAMLLMAMMSSQVRAESCVVHSQAERLDVKVCQENLTIPPELFHDGFCKPQLKDQKVEVTFLEQCPSGSFGQCSNAQVANMPYRQNIHYYGVASDAAFLKPFCEQQSKGIWKAP
ncbi:MULTISPECIES: NADH:ubiquinone oxidoreductase [unclassified Pseudomonas]|uniref:NADH:ubiquinone oxidoreductase n=1 Tax=unclassified Pseudomonas TaxID=196821 RepID=UPI000D391A18|nr:MULTISPECIES: NADH:ubiquinone oxidoreductase [unclassified Pseudomonas]RAU48563.1 NADH:ubiquinone oxidoreductase [Pseudomonas sp. RIT 409]RAU54177.1 NADH:ubiquinone oxidoreductase [Pseudomonas sp. RIT 412]